MMGHILLRGRFSGPGALGFNLPFTWEGIAEFMSEPFGTIELTIFEGTRGTASKSVSSLFRRNPQPGTTIAEPNVCSMVVV